MADGLLPVAPRGQGLLDYRPTVRDRAMGLLGADPTVDRASLLPIGTDAAGEMVWAWPDAVVDTLSSFMLPGHVVQGGAWTPEDATRMALDVGMLGTGGQAARAAAGGREGIRQAMDPATNRMFAGEAAKTADKAALDRAKQMAEAGIDRDSIWSETGWFKDVDGRWKFEIPDDESFMSVPRNAPPGYEALEHLDLQDAYPDLWRTLQQSISPGERARGRYDPSMNTLVASGPTSGQRRSVALHELQHAAQEAEDFARGGNPEGVLQFVGGDPAIASQRARLDELKQAGVEPLLSAAPEFLPPEKRAMVGEYRALLDEVLNHRADPYDLYRRLAGEVEARNVQSRMNMTPEQRRMTPPWETADVPEQDRIVRGLLEGPAESRPAAGGILDVGSAAAAKPRGGLLDDAARAVDDLPMDEASRMARAREMGFDVDTPLYHGTPDTRDAAFGSLQSGQWVRTNKPGELAAFAWVPKEGGRVWYTTDPKYAAIYASRVGKDRGAIYPVFVRKDALKKGSVRSEYYVDDASAVRSRFARFDPAKADSADLLAADVGGGVAGGILSLDRYLEDTDRKRTRAR